MSDAKENMSQLGQWIIEKQMEGTYVRCSFKDLKTGDIFRKRDPESMELENIEGMTEFKAITDAIPYSNLEYPSAQYIIEAEMIPLQGE